jgi:ABC-type branched-subunit amino acid transport system ATPase component
MLALGMVLMSSPKLCMLDEPSGGLSPNYVDHIFETLKQVQIEFGTALLVVEQNLKKAAEMSDRIYGMQAGRMQVELKREKGFDMNLMEQVCLGV